jgi:hypothetical protein
MRVLTKGKGPRAMQAVVCGAARVAERFNTENYDCAASTRRMRSLPRRTHSLGLAGPSPAPGASTGGRTPMSTRSFAGANAHAARSGGGAALSAASSERMMFAQKWSMFRSFLSYPNGSARGEHGARGAGRPRTLDLFAGHEEAEEHEGEDSRRRDREPCQGREHLEGLRRYKPPRAPT